MPLLKGTHPKIFRENVARLVKVGYPQPKAQKVARILAMKSQHAKDSMGNQSLTAMASENKSHSSTSPTPPERSNVK